MVPWRNYADIEKLGVNVANNARASPTRADYN
jgi:hypothetical protein